MSGVWQGSSATTDIVAETMHGLTRPQETAGGVANRAFGVGAAACLRFPGPANSAQPQPEPHCQYAVVLEQLSEFKEIGRTLGGTFNDVVLTLVAGGLRRFPGQQRRRRGRVRGALSRPDVDQD